ETRRAKAWLASSTGALRSCERELPRTRPARQKCPPAAVAEGASATQQRQSASAQRADHANSAPSPKVQQEGATAGAQFPAGRISFARTMPSRQAHFLNIPFQEAHESNSLDSKRTKEPKGEKSCSARHPRLGRAVRK